MTVETRISATKRKPFYRMPNMAEYAEFPLRRTQAADLIGTPEESALVTFCALKHGFIS